jgi:hypothetical protein
MVATDMSAGRTVITQVGRLRWWRQARTGWLPALLLVLALAACSGGRADDGPLGPPMNNITLCLPVQPGRLVTQAFEEYANNGSQVATVERIFLAAPKNIRLAGAFLVPMSHALDVGGIGNVAGFPPRQIPRGVYWSRRMVPTGARISPGELVNVVLGLAPAPGHTTGSTAGVVIWYREGGTEYALRSKVAVIVKFAAS